MSTQEIFDKLRRFDAYPKTLEDFRIKTLSGGAVTIISGIIMGLLFLSELRDYLTPEIAEELFVDTSRGQKMRINLDVVFPKISCSFLSIDAIDVTGEQQSDLEHNIFKRRLNLEGEPITDPVKEQILGDSTAQAKLLQEMKSTKNETCSSCYGAETVEKSCCDTCEDVREAYRRKGWAFKDPESIEQCKSEKFSDKMKEALNEGCQIYGYLEVNKVGGSFHVAPGKSFSVNHVHVHDVQPFASSDFNMTHHIRHLSFGKNIEGKTNPIDGTQTVAEAGAMMFQYFIKIVPTTYVRKDGATLLTNQFSVTKHSKIVSIFTGETGLPGVFFSYEISPLMVKYSEKEKSFGHFATGLCAIIGGVFTVAGLIDSVIYHSARVIKKKIELGKTN